MLDFIYDNSGKPFALKYSTNGGSSFTPYYYVLNLQGDVVKLVNASGTAVATYTYNAWGEVLAATGSMASINPLRYRSYYYDTETGFYYLQSRYYDPVTHRFINADSYASTGQGFVGTNTFAYCGNNPVCGIDPEGARCRPYSVTYTDVGSTYILNQKDLLVDQLPFGYSTIGRSGCGAVATFNALISLGNKKSMWDLIYYFNNEADLVLGGRAGVLPEEVGKYFSNRGYTVVITDEMVLMDALAQTADACILWYLYDTDSFPYFGGHFVEFSRTNTGYIGRNTANGITLFDYPSDYAYDGRRFYAKAIFIFK